MKKPSTHDAYIESAAPFAVPILRKLRSVMRKACPGVQETMKWSAPHFEHEGILAGMAAFKEHVNFGFWKGKEMSDPQGLLAGVGKTGIGTMRLEKLSDLPPERILIQYVHEAVRLNEGARNDTRGRAKKGAKKGAKKAAKKSRAKKEIEAPPELLAALKKSKKALATFEGFSYSNRKEYVEWITEAKRDATREERIRTAVEWMAQGKPRNWKYMKGWS